jgi:hypothetical protein
MTRKTIKEFKVTAWHTAFYLTVILQLFATILIKQNVHGIKNIIMAEILVFCSFLLIFRYSQGWIYRRKLRKKDDTI